MRSTAARNAGGSAALAAGHPVGELRTASTAPLRSLRPSRSTPDKPRRRRELDEAGHAGGAAGMAARYFSCVSATIERPSGVSSAEAGEQRRLGRFALGDARHRDDLRRQAVAEGDGAGLVEQQRVDVARGLHRAARHGEHVELAAAGPCRRCRWPTAGRRWWSGSSVTSSATSTGTAIRRARVGAEARQRHDRDEEHDGHAGEQNRSARSRWASSAAPRPRPARSCDRGMTSRAPT